MGPMAPFFFFPPGFAFLSGKPLRNASAFLRAAASAARVTRAKPKIAVSGFATHKSVGGAWRWGV